MGIKEMADKAKEAAGEAAGKAKEAAGEAAGKAKEAAGDMAEKAGGLAGTVRHRVGGAAEAVVGKVDEMSGGRIPESVKHAVDKLDGAVDEADEDESTDPTGDDSEGSGEG
jgi:uncharacterized protein YjbJ (UPF0337 family)